MDDGLDFVVTEVGLVDESWWMYYCWRSWVTRV